MKLVKITSNVLGSNTATITFSSIPQAYTDLYVNILCKHTDTGSTLSDLRMKINTFTTGYYDMSGYRYDDSTSTGAGTTAQRVNQTLMKIGNNAVIGAQRDAGANPWSHHRVYIPAYSSTDRYKIVNTRSGANYILTGFARLGWSIGLVDDISAVSSLEFTTESGFTFVAGSRFELYGIA